MGMFFYETVQEDLEQVELMVIDEDQTFETNTLIQQLENDETIGEQVIFHRGDRSLSEYLDESIDYAAVVRIPKGFTEQLQNGQNEEIEVYLNNQIPFSSQLAYLLLHSGQGYITAAQSGVNTVNHFWGSELPSDERRDLVEQMTVHFSFLTLGRNSLFLESDLSSVDILSWDKQLYVTGFVLLYILTLIFFAFLFRPKEWSLINQRLYLIDVTLWKRALGRFLHLISFSFVYLLITAVTGALLLFDVNSLMLTIQWTLLATIICLLMVILETVIRTPALSLFLFSLTSLTVLTISGLIIPRVYLPDWMTVDAWYPIQSLYFSFYQIINEQTWPIGFWGILWLLLLFMLFILWLMSRRGDHV